MEITGFPIDIRYKSSRTHHPVLRRGGKRLKLHEVEAVWLKHARLALGYKYVSQNNFFQRVFYGVQKTFQNRGHGRTWNGEFIADMLHSTGVAAPGRWHDLTVWDSYNEYDVVHIGSVVHAHYNGEDRLGFAIGQSPANDIIVIECIDGVVSLGKYKRHTIVGVFQPDLEQMYLNKLPIFKNIRKAIYQWE